MPHSGLGLETGQSLPPAIVAPAPVQRTERVLPRRPLARPGTGSSARPSASRAQPRAAACWPPRRARRSAGTSSGWTTWMCAMWCRRSFGPFIVCAPPRTRPAPPAPHGRRSRGRAPGSRSASSSVTYSFSASGSTIDRPLLSVGVPAPVEVRRDHPGSEVLRHAVLHDLDRRRPEPIGPELALDARSCSAICSRPRSRCHQSAPTTFAVSRPVSSQCL